MVDRRHSGSGRPAARSMLGDEEPGAAHGAALGVGGIEGWWVWKHRRRLRNGVDAVSPASLRGMVHVLLWVGGLAALTILGPLLIDWPRAVWFGIALLPMLAIGRWWDTRIDRSPNSSGAP